MLVICNSIQKRELTVLREYFSTEDILRSTMKAKAGLGFVLKGSPFPRTQLIKLYVTGRSAPARLLLLLLVDEKWYMPVLLRLKSDKVGINMTMKNPDFQRALDKNLSRMVDDLKNMKFKKYLLEQ